MSHRLSTAIKISEASNAILQRVLAFDKMHNKNQEDWKLSADIGIDPMLLALAMELALKAWYVFDHDTDKVLRSHNLEKLFDGLLPASQEKLETGFRLSIVPYHGGGWFQELELRDVLSNHANAFVDWRYLHEAQSASFDVSTFTATLEMVLQEFNKRFRTVKYQPFFFLITDMSSAKPQLVAFATSIAAAFRLARAAALRLPSSDIA